MSARLLLNVRPRLAGLTHAGATRRATKLPLRLISTDTENKPSILKSKYAQKLEQLAKERGASVEELVQKAKEEAAARRAEEAEKLKSTLKPKAVDASVQSPTTSGASSSKKHVPSGERKDAAPYKPLSSFLNLPIIQSSPHTADQVSALWVAYHTSRSGGTGRGFVCATIPLDIYRTMEETASKYRSFVVPVARTQKDATTGEEKTSHEFFYLQWDFHPSPVVPSAVEDPFVKPTSTGSNPRISTVIFTPLDEYKRRGSYATPYLILTLYTDLVTTHGIVLLRGEITPSSAAATVDVNSSDRYLLSQVDAQALLVSLQQFYLWTADASQKENVAAMKLLRTFHEKPEEFKWEDLINVNPI